MALIESSSVTAARRTLVGSAPERDDGRYVVWLRGDHDIATVASLSERFAEAFSIDDADIVADLSGVTFMGAATVGVLARARDFLGLRSRSLELRSPSARARRVLDLCDVALLADRPPKSIVSVVGSALGSWVAVPARRADGHIRNADRRRDP